MARIINYTEATGLSEGDYIIIDNERGATKKLSLTNLIIKALNEDGKIPDAKTVGDAIAAVRAIAEANAEEIAGAKIGTDGTEYYSIGEHITMSVGALRTLIDSVSEECPNVLDYALLPSGGLPVRGVTITKSDDVLSFTGTADSSSEVVSRTIPLTANTQYTAKIYSDSDKLINVEFTFIGDTPTGKAIRALNTPLSFVVPRNTTLVSMSISPVSGNVYSGDTYRISINRGNANDYYIKHFSGITAIDRVARDNSGSSQAGVIESIRHDLSLMNTASSSDAGKALKAKTISNGKVVEWEFGETGEPDPEIISQAVENWLDEHPDATTSVADGSIGETKLSVALKPLIFNYYVTPEMYGAVGDGITNDTNALAQAFSSGKPVVLTKGKKYFAMQITITNPLIVIGNFATISTRSITAEEYSSGGQRLLIFEDSATQIYIKDINFYTTADQTVYGAHGDRDPAIPNRSMRCAIAAYGVDKLSIVNCTFTNFDTPINGQRHGSDSEYAHIAKNVYLKDLQISNSLMGVIGYFRHIVVDGCEIVEDVNARSGEHCLYVLIDALDTAIIANSAFYAEGDCGSCIQFYIPNTTTTLPEGMKREYRISNCMLFGDAFISNSGGGKCYASACTMKTINYKTANRRRQFECAITDGGVIEVTDSTVNLELQDRIDQALIFRNCNIYSNRLLSDRFALYKAYGCQFDNVGFRVADGAEIINCVFSSSISVLGKYYITVPSTTTASNIVDCVFKTGANVNSIAYQCAGACNLISAISELPIGTDNPGLVVIHKIDSTGSSDSGGSGDDSSGSANSGLSGKRVVFFGDSICYGEGNNGHSFIDIINEMGICTSLVKEAHTSSCIGPYQVYSDGAGYDLLAMIELRATAITNADIVFCGYGGNDTHAVSVGNIQLGHYTDASTATTVCGYMRKAIDRIRTLNPSVRLCWLFPQLRDFVIARGGSVADNDYFVTVIKAMSDVCEDLNVTFMGLYTGLNMNLVDGGHLINDTAKHPTEAGHSLIAENVLYGYPFSVCPFVPKRVVTLSNDGTMDCNFKKLLLMISHDIDVTIIYSGIVMHCCYYSANSIMFESDVMTSTTSKTKHTLLITSSSNTLYTSVENVSVQPWGDSGGGGEDSGDGYTVLYSGTATIVSSTPNYVTVNNFSELINEGETWRITWNGTEYVCIAKYSSQVNGGFIGNSTIVGGADSGNNEPFWAYKRTDTQLAFSTTDSAGTITLKVEKLEE